MHANFADWYRRITMSPSDDLLQKRWAGIETLLTHATQEIILSVLRTLTLTKVNASTELGSSFVGPFKEADAAFPLKENAEELRVLAAAFLHALIDKQPSTTLADRAALGLVAAAFAERDAHIPEMEHLTRARRYVHERARDIRDPKGAGAPAAPTIPPSLTALKPVCDANSLPALAEPLAKALDDLGKHLIATHNALRAETKTLRAKVDTQDEELKLLWWLQTAVSRDLGVPFSSIGSAAPFVLASEVARLVSQRPGPTFTPALLVQAVINAGQGESKLSISDVVGATSSAWRSEFVRQTNPKPIGALCPLTFAVASSLETDGPDDWHPLYRKTCEVSLTQPFPALQLAAQLYNERLFLETVER